MNIEAGKKGYTEDGLADSEKSFGLFLLEKENGLDPYRYLLWVLKQAPKLFVTDQAWAEKLTPDNAPAVCRTK